MTRKVLIAIIFGFLYIAVPDVTRAGVACVSCAYNPRPDNVYYFYYCKLDWNSDHDRCVSGGAFACEYTTGECTNPLGGSDNDDCRTCGYCPPSCSRCGCDNPFATVVSNGANNDSSCSQSTFINTIE